MSAPVGLAAPAGLGTPGCPAWLAPHTAGVFSEPSGLNVAGCVGAKPPWNQPQVMFFWLSRSPTLLPPICTVLAVAVPPLSAPQSSWNGSGSLMTVPLVSPAPKTTLPSLTGVGPAPAGVTEK